MPRRTLIAASLAALALAGTLAAQDLSDAPSPYPNFSFFQSSQSGVRLDYLGNGVTDDAGYGAGWTDDGDDDGIEFLNMNKGGTATLKVALVQSFTSNDLTIWMDFNNDGDWADSGERVVWAGYSSGAPNGAFSAKVAPPYGGSSTSFNTYTVSIPAGAAGTNVKVRAVFWDTSTHPSGVMAPNGGGSASGWSDYGEVEDFDIPYGTSTGSKPEVYQSNGTTQVARIYSGGSQNAGNLTAGNATNLFWDITNNRNASTFVRFTNAYPSATITYSSATNCTLSLFTPANGVTIGPGGGYFTFIGTITPTTAGLPFSFVLSMPTNDPLNPTYTWTVSGNAASPAPTLDLQRPTYTSIPGSGTDNVGALPAGTAANLQYTIMNTGTANLSLTGSPIVQLSGFSNCSATVSAQPSVSTLQPLYGVFFTVDVTPTTSGQGFSFSMSIASNDTARNPYTITVSGTAGTQSGSPEIDVKRGTAVVANNGTDSVGSATVGVGTGYSYTIENTGTAALNLVGSPMVQLSNLSNCSALVSAQPGSSGVAAGGSTGFTVTVTPGSAAAFSVKVSIANNDSDENPYSFTISGTGSATAAPEMDLQRSGGIADGGTDNVGIQPAAGSNSFTYTVSNTGNAVLSVSTVQVGATSNCSVNVTAQPASSVAAGGSTTFTISVTPAGAGSFTANLSIPNDDSNENPYDFTIAGTGQVIAPDIAVQRPLGVTIAGTEALGTVAFGTQQALTYTIINTGTQALNLTGSPLVAVAAGSNCTVVVNQQPAGATLAAGATTTFTISLNVLAAGAFSYSVSILNNVVGKNPYAFTTNGTGGTLPEIDVRRSSGGSVSTGGSINLGAVATGSAGSLGFFIANTGNATLNLTGTPTVQISGQNNVTATVNTLPGSTVSPGAAATFAVNFAVPAGGPFSFVVTIASNDADEGSYSFTVQGDGGAGLFSRNGGGGGGGCSAGHDSQRHLLVLGALLLVCVAGWRRTATRRQ
ncbi:MAG: choice-of-anchor D domain-containing protein [Planctomycetes bacterium]|nr:choice-of-anchor D domain-containing protein [Planctomycetota bacterium]